MADIEFQGTGGIIEGDLEDANVIVNLDKALKFDGTNDYINCGTDTDYDITADLCIAAWIKNDNSTTTSGSSEMILTKYAGTNGERCYRIYVQGTTLKFSCAGTGGTSADTYTLQYSMADILDKWNHVAGVFDQGHMYIYVNGKQKAYYDHTAEPAINVQNSRAVEIGSYEGGSNTWEGHIADVRIYNDHLLTGGAGTATSTSTHIELLASKINTDKTLGAGTTNLKGYWKLNYETATGGTAGDGGNGFVPDESGTVNQGTLTNFPTSPAYWDYDAFSVNVQKDGTTTDGSFTITQGKVEGKALTSLHFHDDNDYVDIGELGDYTAISMTAWVNPDDATPTSQGIVGFEGNQNGIATGSGSNVLRIKHESVNSSYTDTTYTWAQNKWQQVGFSWDGSTLNVFADGVKINSVSLSGSAWGTSNADIGALTNTTWNFDGQIRDVKLYDYGLSDDQMASLYSGSYNVTPKYWYKLDDCVVGTSITTAVSSGTATSVDGTLTNFENTDGDPLDGAGTGWSNGTLNLDGTLTIEANGTLSAPRGNLDLEGDLDINCTTVADQWIHNSGKVRYVAGAGATWTPNNASFNNIDLATSSGHDLDLRENITILGTLDLTGSTDYFVVDAANAAGNITMTMGDDNNQATIESNTADTFRPAPHSSREILITGGSSLKPCLVTGQDWKWDYVEGAAGIKLANMNFDPDIVTDTGESNAVKIILTGDCEFDAVTVSSGDTLDVDGQRVYSSGTVDINGNLKMGAGMWHAGGDFDTSNAAVTEEEGATFLLEGDNYIHNNDGSFAGDANTNILLQGTKSTYLNSFESGGYAHYVGNLIVGSGTATLPGPDRSGVLRGKANNITVASGATLTPSGAQEVICLGDFTTTGGLIGTNCIVFDGTDDYVASAVFNDDRSVNNSADYTIELWFRRTETSGTETLFDFAHWDSDGSVYTGQSRSSAYMDANGIIYWDTRTGGGTLNARPQSSAGFDDSKWHHAAFVFKGVSGAHAGTYSAGAKEIWIDGKLEARVLGGDTTTDAGSSVAGNMGYDQNKTMAFQVGRQVVSSIGNFFTGQMDEIRMWSDARTQAEIRDNMFSAVAIDSANLRHYYDCNLFHSSKLEDMADSNTGEDHVEVDITFYGGATYAGTGIFDDGSTTLVMAGTTQTITMKNGNDVNNLTINDGSTTSLLTTDNSAGSIDVVGDLTVHGQLKPLTGKDTCLTMKTNGAKFMIPQALTFDGSDDFITCGTDSSLDITSAITCSAWVRVENGNADTMFIICKNDDSSDRSYHLVTTETQVQFAIYDGNVEKRAIYDSADGDKDPVNDGQWHHLAGTYDGSTVKVYVDGAIGGTTVSYSGDIDSHADEPVFLGQRGNGNRRLKGDLADVRIYNAALSATEVATLASQIIPNDARTNNLVSHWKLNEVGTSTTTTATDSAGSNNGTLTNFPSSPWFGNNQTAVNQIYTIFMDVGGTHTNGINLPEFKAKILKCNDSTTTAKGDITCSTELHLVSGSEFNANGNTLTVKELDVNGSAILDLRNSTVDFSVTSSGDELSIEGTANLLTGNTTITGHTGQQTPATLPEEGNFEVVGNVSDIKIMSDGDLTVIGSVTNCLLQTTEANIRQWHHTLDTQQLLDADEDGDDDLRLTKPALDNAHELMTG